MEENVKLKESPFTGQQGKPSELITYLYIGHFLARWGARMWEFSVGLYMINIWSESLLYAAIYGAVESASIAVFGSIIGRWVDKFFGTLMTATLKWEGIPAYVIGIARGISVVIGIAATAVYPVLQSHISTIRTGLWSIWSQDLVSESDRLIVGGVQSSLQSLMGLLAYVMGIIISDPRDFWKLTSISSSSHISCIPLLYNFCIHFSYHLKKEFDFYTLAV
ncbi:hypothetical protein JHK85_006468 [Glycine max]|nr:hypothetical protein JHK85_006468 [Glycine max]